MDSGFLNTGVRLEQIPESNGAVLTRRNQSKPRWSDGERGDAIEVSWHRVRQLRCGEVEDSDEAVFVRGHEKWDGGVGDDFVDLCFFSTIYGVPEYKNIE